MTPYAATAAVTNTYKPLTTKPIPVTKIAHFAASANISKNLPNNEIKFLCLSSKNSVIPSSRHLESEILINSDYIFENILKAYKLWKK